MSSLNKAQGGAEKTAPGARPDASFAERLFVAGVTALIPIVPPGAPLLPSCKYDATSLGKVPGIKHPSGLWSGVSWRDLKASADDVRRWVGWGANIGLRADNYPSLDIDCTDAALAQVIEEAALAKLGPAPVRIGRAPKRLLMYRLAEGAETFGRIRLWVRRPNDENHLVELLTRGQQFLVSGVHPTTGKPYEWLSDPTAQPLTPITCEQVNAFFDHLQGLIEMLGLGSVERVGDGRKSGSPAADQTALLAPSIEVLAEAVALIPNDDTTARGREEYIGMGYAIRAAAGEENEHDGYEIFARWAGKHEADGRVAGNPDTWRSDWRRMKGPYKAGWSWIAERARGYGFNDASEDFTSEGTKPPEDGTPGSERVMLARFNKRFAFVRSLGLILHTPRAGSWELMKMPAWHDYTRRDLVFEGKKLVPYANRWLADANSRIVSRLVFEPELPPLSVIPSLDGDPEPVFNQWPGLALEPSEDGSCDLLLRHLRDVIANGDQPAYQWVMMWLADMVQNPGTLPGTALMLRGPQGAGKDIVGRVMRAIIGDRLHVTINSPEQLLGKFNADHQSKLMLHAEEAFFAGNRGDWGRLKSMVTSDTVSVEQKGRDRYEVRNCARIFATSNETWIAGVETGDRRFMVLDVSGRYANDDKYFTALRSQMFRDGGCAAFLHHLKYEVEVDRSVIRRPLPTVAHQEQQLESMDASRSWLHSVLTNGELPGDERGDGVTLTTSLFEEFKKACADRRDATPVRFGRFLARYGVTRVRVNSGGKRPWAYQFPELPDCRKRFGAEFSPALTWDEQTEWSGDPVVDGSIGLALVENETTPRSWRAS